MINIRRISCTQFAGLTEKSIQLESGINILCGKNESGKSTLVHLLSRTLFQNAKLDKRSDRDFRQLYFPAPRAGYQITGDFIDGTVTLETEDGLYTLKKEWGEDPRCSLTTPAGILRGSAQIEETLRTILEYGEGVWEEILLTSQNHTAASLYALLEPGTKSDIRTEISSAVTAAFAETGTVSVEAIGQAIEEKLESLAGKHWDTETDMPQRKSGGGRWASGLGEILKAYYDREDARFVLSEVQRLETERDHALAACEESQLHLEHAEQNCQEFGAFAEKLSLQKERRESLQTMDKEAARLNAALQNWPRIEKEFHHASALREEQKARSLLDVCRSARVLLDNIEEIRHQLETLPTPTAEEIQQVKRGLQRIRTLENQLSGMNLSALLHMQGGHTAEIRSLRTNEIVSLSEGHAALTEAVRITIPGVMDMVLSPADTDAEAVQRELTPLRQSCASILSTYNTESPEALEDLLRRRMEYQRELSFREERLAGLLGDRKYEELQRQVEEMQIHPRPAEEILSDIRALVPTGSLDSFISARETMLAGYREEYAHPDALTQRYNTLQNQMEELRTLLLPETEIPEHYRKIADPRQYLQTLKEKAESLRSSREDALRRKTEAMTRLETFCQSLKEDPAETAEKAEQIFSQTSELLHHWLHIYRVFEQQKQHLSDNPMQPLAQRFVEYLSLLSDGHVTSDFPEENSLQMQILTGDRLVDYAKLSEGTKQIVSLAFRMAVLDQLFPAGGGFLVLDDPLTDMDADRTKQACCLIRECAKKHQILFLTCREEYLDELPGHVCRLN